MNYKKWKATFKYFIDFINDIVCYIPGFGFLYALGSGLYSISNFFTVVVVDVVGVVVDVVVGVVVDVVVGVVVVVVVVEVDIVVD